MASPAPGLTAAYSHDGGDVGVLVCHGFTGSPDSMRGWAEHLAQAGYTVRLPRLPGHGTRWQDANRTTFDDWLATVTAALADLSARCRAVFVCGLSMGGTLTLRLAELHPEAIAGIVLVNPSILTQRKDMTFLPVLKHLVPALKGIASDIADPDAVELGYDRTPLKALDSLRRAWPVVRADLGSITMPVLLLRSRVDHVVEPENSRVLLATIGSSDVTEIVLERSYHVATLDYDKQVIFDASVEFIRRITGETTDPASATAGDMSVAAAVAGTNVDTVDADGDTADADGAPGGVGAAGAGGIVGPAGAGGIAAADSDGAVDAAAADGMADAAVNDDATGTDATAGTDAADRATDVAGADAVEATRQSKEPSDAG